jgi:tetratricopeptide (TPR) repeat protein
MAKGVVFAGDFPYNIRRRWCPFLEEIMPMSSHLLQRGTALWKNGRKDEARKIFETVIHNDSRNETAWVWYIYSLESDNEKIAALKDFLAIFPEHATAQKALAGLQAKELASRPPEVTPEKEAERIPPVQLTPVQVVQPVKRSQSAYIPWALALLGLCLLLFTWAVYIKDRNSLQARVESLTASNLSISQNLARLDTAYKSLQSENQSLSDRYTSLEGQHTALQGQYDTLNTDYTALSGRYDTLSAEHTSLTNSYNELLTNYNSAMDSYSAFREVAIAPPYIYTRERQVHLVFQKLDGSLIHWTIPSEWLEYHLRLGDEQRNHMTYDLVLKNDFTDEIYDVVDDRDFIDETPFTNLMENLYREAPDDATFIAEVWNIVAQLTAYTDEIDETPRFPMETLLSGGGDCEDHAILFASMILAAPTSWEVNFIYMDSDHPNQPEVVNHVIVQVVTPAGPYLVEATSKYSIDPYNGTVTGWAFPVSRTGD